VRAIRTHADSVFQTTSTKSPEVRSWMRDSNNYRLEKGAGKGGNCYRGAQNRSRYDLTDPIGPRQKSNYGHD